MPQRRDFAESPNLQLVPVDGGRQCKRVQSVVILMITELLGRDASVGELGQTIVARAAGNPFLAEEIVLLLALAKLGCRRPSMCGFSRVIPKRFLAGFADIMWHRRQPVSAEMALREPPR